jgi:hypothetical protein
MVVRCREVGAVVAWVDSKWVWVLEIFWVWWVMSLLNMLGSLALSGGFD